VNKFYLVTGGTGFLGSALVHRLVREGCRVRVLDNNSRGSSARLTGVLADVELCLADVRDPVAVARACSGVQAVCHMAYVNGTEFFYQRPDEILEIAVKGMTNVLDGCAAAGVPELVLASTSEVYQTPPSVPTDETVALSVPDPLNPRYSYGGGKIISELMVLSYGIRRLSRVLVFRPHNVYGPDMGWEHVIPQFALRMAALRGDAREPAPFPIQGTGRETRSFVHVNDFIDGLMMVIEKGEHRNIYNIGSTEEVAVADLAQAVASCFGRRVEVVPGRLAEGSAPRRCPDIRKLEALGYRPRVPLSLGLPPTVEWYADHADRAPRREAPQEVSG
jgi:dTDP-glucose 4,6-dehydratase/UDP-glucose 4-epimerase